MTDITEQDILDGWKRWGDGTELRPGFAKWLAEELNKKTPKLPVTVGYSADLINQTIGFQIKMLWGKPL